MAKNIPRWENASMFWENYNTIMQMNNEKEYMLLDRLNIPRSSIVDARRRNAYPHLTYVYEISKALGIKVEDFFKSPEELTLDIRNQRGQPEQINSFDVVPIPVFSQKVAAGNGQEVLSDSDIIGTIPFLKRMLRGITPLRARAVEVRGDSMTGIQLFDGDMVVFIPGEIHGDGIYVIRIMNDLYVKRVEFDPVSQKIRIMSENPRYPDRIESADGQTVEVVGKVYGWIHAHPY